METKQNSGCLGLLVWVISREGIVKVYEVYVSRWWMYSINDHDNDYNLCEYAKKHWIEQFKRLCALHLKKDTTKLNTL